MFATQLLSPNGQALLKLEGELTIYTVHEARDAVTAAMALHPSLKVDLAGVEEIDTAGVQLLVWLKQEAHAHGQTLPFVFHSPAVLEVFDLLHLTGSLGDPVLITP